MQKLVLAFFLLIALLLFRPLLGNSWYPVHDTTSIARVYLLEKTLQGGQVPAIWAAELNEGAGYPLFHFYAPAFTYLALLGKTLTGSYFDGVKIVLFLVSVFGMTGMYLLVRKWGRAAGLVAATSYALLPYAALNLYVRGAFAEYLAMTLLPWVFYAWQNVKSTRSQVFAAVITTLFILSHNLIPLITLPFLLVWIFLNGKKNIKALLLPTLLTLGLSLFYLAPLVFERGFVQVDKVAATTDFAKHFVAPTQLWNSTWGFGGSGIGIEDGMSFKVGKIQLVLATVAGLFILLKRKKFWYFPVGLAIAAFMTTSSSSLLWSKLPYLSLVQFPWRFLTLVGFFASVLAGYSLTLIKNNLLKTITSLILVAVLLYINLKLFLPQTVFPAEITSYTSTSYLSTIPEIVPEYRPVWIDQANPERPSSTVLSHYYYPTWQITLDGKRVATFPSKDGYLAFANPNNSTNYTAVQAHTPLEYWAILVSIASLVLALKLYAKN